MTNSLFTRHYLTGFELTNFEHKNWRWHKTSIIIHVPGFVQVMENLDYHEIEEFIFPAWKVIENFSYAR